MVNSQGASRAKYRPPSGGWSAATTGMTTIDDTSRDERVKMSRAGRTHDCGAGAEGWACV